MEKYLLIFCCFCTFLFANGVPKKVKVAQANGSWVTVEATGKTKEEAMLNAKRTAIEQVIGTFIASKTLVRNTMMLGDTIFSSTQGFVTESKIVSVKKVDHQYVVVGKFFVKRDKIGETIGEMDFFQDLFHHQRVLVVYLPPPDEVRQRLLQDCSVVLHDAMLQRHFRVFNREELDDFYQRLIAKKNLQSSDLRELVSNTQADFVVELQLTITEETPSFHHQAEGYKLTLVVKASNRETGRVFANFTEASPVVLVEDPLQKDTQLLAAAQELAYKMSMSLFEKLSYQITQIRPQNEYILSFWNFATSHTPLIYKTIRTIPGVRYTCLSTKKEGYLELEVAYDGEYLIDLVYEKLRAEGMDIKILSQEPNTISFGVK